MGSVSLMMEKNVSHTGGSNVFVDDKVYLICEKKIKFFVRLEETST